MRGKEVEENIMMRKRSQNYKNKWAKEKCFLIKNFEAELGRYRKSSKNLKK